MGHFAISTLDAMKGTLERERIHDVVLSENNNTACGLFSFFDSERASLETETRVQFAAKKRQNP